jgi:hypothetical protein
MKQRTIPELIEALLRALEGFIADSPLVCEEHYSTQDYIYGDDRIVNSRTMGFIIRAAWTLPEVCVVDVEHTFKKWHPDITLRDAQNNILLVIDYESPNSSDYRVIDRDVWKYVEWGKSTGNWLPYLIITTLPKQRSIKWELLYSREDKSNPDKSGWNWQFRERAAELKESPFGFWYSVYSDRWSKEWQFIHFANFDGRKVSRVEMPLAKVQSQIVAPSLNV